MSVEYQGLDRVLKFIEDLPKIIERASEDLLEIMADIVYTYTQRFVPVRTGRLKRSGRHIKVSALRRVLRYGAPYAGFVELGTSRMRAQPYVRPAIALMEGFLDESTIKGILELELY